MKVLRDGHAYELEHLDGPGTTLLEFVNREPGEEREGPTTQEVIRALIDRTYYCDHCLPCALNEQAVFHLRMALSLHEARHLIRATEKGDLKPERIEVHRDDQHFRLDGVEVVADHMVEPRDYGKTNTGGSKPGQPCYLVEVKEKICRP